MKVSTAGHWGTPGGGSPKGVLLGGAAPKGSSQLGGRSAASECFRAAQPGLGEAWFWLYVLVTLFRFVYRKVLSEVGGKLVFRVDDLLLVDN